MSSAFSQIARIDLPTYFGLSPSGKDETSVWAPPGCKVIDEHKDGGYATPVEAENKYETFISRIREDSSQPNSINLWIVSDNLLKGAALNAVEIAEALIEKDFYGK